MRSKSKVLILLLVITLALTGCSSGSDEGDTGNDISAEGGDESKDNLIVAMASEPSTLDGNGKDDSASVQVRTQMYEGLVTQNAEMEVVPVLAEDWEYEDDTTIIFHIRQGVKFHDGTELKASDVKFSLERAYEMGFAAADLSAVDFEKCEAVDDYTYKLVLKHPFAPIISSLAASSAAIVPQNVVEEKGEDYLSANPIGTGPYKLEEWIQGDRIELIKNEDYWDEVKGVDSITMRFITETANRAIEVEIGGVDIAYDVSPNDIDRLKDNPDVEVLQDMSLSTTYIAFNCQKEPFTDSRVRQAIAYALDIENIVDSVYFGTGTTGKNVLAPTVWGCSENVKPLGYDPEKAKALLEEAGYSDGFKTKIWVSDNQQRIDIAEIAQNQLKEVGIDCEVKILEWGTFLEALENKELDIFLLGNSVTSGDGDELYYQFHSESNYSGNTAYYRNPEVDAMIEESRVIIDDNERAKKLEDIQKVVIEEAPWIPVWHGEIITGIRNNVKGFENHPTGNHRLFNIYFE